MQAEHWKDHRSTFFFSRNHRWTFICTDKKVVEKVCEWNVGEEMNFRGSVNASARGFCSYIGPYQKYHRSPAFLLELGITLSQSTFSVLFTAPGHNCDNLTSKLSYFGLYQSNCRFLLNVLPTSGSIKVYSTVSWHLMITVHYFSALWNTLINAWTCAAYHVGTMMLFLVFIICGITILITIS